ncbi:MAG: MgtC/SapB family protein [Oscillospiraceae bacterium]|nr:MgtC/SapB family protein [Oscillospiraceae bacterium]
MQSAFFSSFEIATSPLLDCCCRLAVSCILGMLIGIERSKRFKEAGVRTHIVVCCGAALCMIVSKYGFADLGGILDGSRTSDPARLAAQVVSGIGFLGAGVIFKNGNTVRGLTTAAVLWFSAVVGLTVGAGMYVMGILAALVNLLLLVVLHRYAIGGDAYAANHLHFIVKNGYDFNGALMNQMELWQAQVTESKVDRRRDGTTEYDLTVRRRKEIEYAEMKTFMESREDVISASNSPIR